VGDLRRKCGAACLGSRNWGMHLAQSREDAKEMREK
jgi:hypothetical protein